jgi:dTDP-4-amino-4,6-dideoxygalactose transaminase
MNDQTATSQDRPALLGGTPVRTTGPPEWPPDDPLVREALERAIADRSWGRYHGPHCEQLSDFLAEYHESAHVQLCSSGTAAVELALRGLQVSADDEVILAAYDFKGNFANVVSLGAKPVLVDLDAANWNFDVEQLEAAVGPKTKAIIVSHLHGGVVPMPAVMDFVRAHQLPVIEDACQMPGAGIFGKTAGTWGDVGVLSFGGSKLTSAGRGGALFTNDSGIAQRIRLYTERGNQAYPLSELQAVVLLPQWQQLEERNQKRADSVGELCDQLSGFKGLTLFTNPPSDSPPGYYKLGFQYRRLCRKSSRLCEKFNAMRRRFEPYSTRNSAAPKSRLDVPNR